MSGQKQGDTVPSWKGDKLVRLIEARQAQGLTQADLARLIDRSTSHYAKIERGEVGLYAADALTLCNALGLSLTELLETGPR